MQHLVYYIFFVILINNNTVQDINDNSILACKSNLERRKVPLNGVQLLVNSDY